MNFLFVVSFSALVVSCQTYVKRPEEYLTEWEDYKVSYFHYVAKKIHVSNFKCLKLSQKLTEFRLILPTWLLLLSILIYTLI